MKSWVLIGWLTLGAANGATYYVALTGSDANSGSDSLPWLTLTNAAAKVVAGDNVIVMQGVYTNSVTFSVAASEGSRITFMGSNATHTGTVRFNQPFYTISNFVFNGSNTTSFQRICSGNSTSHHAWILGNTFTNLPADRWAINWEQASKYPESNASFLVISNNSFFDNTNCVVKISTHGGTNRIVNNFFTGGTSGEPDYFHFLGRGTVVSGNMISNAFVNALDSAKGADIYQMFGFRSWQLYTFSAGFLPVDGDTITIDGITRTWKDTVTDATTQIQITSNAGTNMTNLFNHAVANPFSGMISNRWVLSPTRLNFYRVTESSNLTVVNVGTWFESSTAFNNNAVVCKDLTFENNIFWNVKGSQLFQTENYENLYDDITNIVFRNNVFNVGLAGAIGISGVKLYNNVFWKCSTNSFGFCFTFGSDKGNAYGLEFKNNAFVLCGNDAASTNGGWYTPGSGQTNYGLDANYNFVAGANWWPKQEAPPDATTRWKSYGWEANGINGGNPLFVDPTNGNFRLANGSPLIDAGVSIASFSTDALGNARGASWDIGVYEFSNGTIKLFGPANLKGNAKLK